MHLSVSNIAWDLEEQPAILDLLADVDGIEIAPTKLWPNWEGASQAAAIAVRAQLGDRGLRIPALQAILYQRNEALFRDGQAGRSLLFDHLRFVGDLASAIGASVMVFGAPGQRDPGALSTPAALDIAAEFFGRLGPEMTARGVCLCLEANPVQYGCRFLTSAAEAASLVKAVNSPGIGLHLDAACMHLAGDDIRTVASTSKDAVRHFHISEPFLSGFDSPVVDHVALSAVLRALPNCRWLSIEMKRHEPAVDFVRTAIRQAKKYYGSIISHTGAVH